MYILMLTLSVQNTARILLLPFKRQLTFIKLLIQGDAFTTKSDENITKNI